MSENVAPFTVLVVDDDERNRMLAEAVLESGGYVVKLASNGFEALESFEKEASDLILLDVMMPKMDGYETCRRLRQLEGGEDVPVLFLTAQSEVAAHQQALDSGADDFLTKPLNRTELLIRVRSLIRIRKLQRKLEDNYELMRGQRDVLLRTERQKQELTDLIVHDLKSPLAGILTNVEYVLTLPDISKDSWDALHDVVGGVRTMLSMVVNLLDISRSEDGALVPSLGAVDILEIVEVVRGASQRRADLEKRKIIVKSVLPSVPMRADADLLRRLVENLVDNCLKYTPRGTSVVLDVSRGDGFVRISVKDEGDGIPARHRSRIFEKYAQIEQQEGDSMRSSRGLGLAFCKLAAEAHGGRIWVEDNIPKGSAFVVDLPA